MKKSLLTVFLILSSMILMAQESFTEEYRVNIGDTLLWRPFTQCNNISYKVSSKDIVEFTPTMGGKVQVIAMKEGTCQLKATCGDVVVNATIIVGKTQEAPITEKVELQKPETQTFTGTYQFNPPTDHFFITFSNPLDEYRETYAKIEQEEAYNNGNGIDRFWNTSSGANYYYVPESQGWTDDVAWDFEAFGDSFFPLNAFAREVNTEENLSKYYTGTEPVMGIDCWTFFVEMEDGNVVRYWVDPSNGCTLKRIVNDEKPYEITVYDLNYTKWFFGPKYKKSLHDKTR